MAHTVVGLPEGSGLPVRAIITDNGSEFAVHETVARKLGTTVHLARPYSFWEKGIMENMNGLVRL